MAPYNRPGLSPEYGPYSVRRCDLDVMIHSATRKSALAMSNKSLPVFLRSDAAHSIISNRLFVINSATSLWLQHEIIRVLANCEDTGVGEKVVGWDEADIVVDLDRAPSSQERLKWLQAAAHEFSGSLYLVGLDLRELGHGDQKWIKWARESLYGVDSSVQAGPKRLFVSHCWIDEIEDLFRFVNQKPSIQELVVSGTRGAANFSLPAEGLRLGLGSLYMEGVPSYFVKSLSTLEKGSIACSLILHASSEWDQRWLPSFSKFLEWPLKYLSLTGFEMQLSDGISFLKSLQALGSGTRLFSLSLGTFAGPPDILVDDIEQGVVIDALQSSGLQYLRLDGFPRDAATEAQLLRNRAQYPRLLRQRAQVPATALRLFLCGEPYAGKTTLMSSLAALCRQLSFSHKLVAYMKRYGIDCISKNPARTKGIQVRSLVRDNIQVSVWDMAGQQEFHAFHDHMFPDPSGSASSPAMFLFVWSPVSSKNEKDGNHRGQEEFEDSFRYWLKFITSKTRQSNVARKVIVVLTRKDQMDFVKEALEASIQALATSFRNVIDVVRVLEVDARSPTSVKPVASCIFEVARALLQGVQVYSICKDIDEYLCQVSHSMPPIVSWDFFRNICDDNFQVSDPQVQKAIAFSLNESGKIIYLNDVPYIVLKPDWFCHEILGSLIHFQVSYMSRTMPIRGYVQQPYLEKLLAQSSHSGVDGGILVKLMEGMHLCCKVPNDPCGTILIPATLDPIDPRRVLHWQGGIQGHHQELYYVGRRLKSNKEDLTFFTPGLFPTIQVLFKKAFGDVEADVELQRDFISIFIRNIEILVIFGDGKEGSFIDVVMRAPLLAKLGGTLTCIRKEVVGTIIKICAQPIGIQGVKLVESVIRPDLLYDPTLLQKRQDHYVSVELLKRQLRRCLDEGQKAEEQEFFWRSGQDMECATYSYIDLLGIEDYLELLKPYKLSLAKAHASVFSKGHGVAGDENETLLDHNVDDVDQSFVRECKPSTSACEVERDSVCDQEVESEEQQSVVSKVSRGMVRGISMVLERMEKMDAKLDVLTAGVDAIHRNLKCELDSMHQSITDLRSDLVSVMKIRLKQFLELSVEKEVGRVPRLVFLSTEGLGKRQRLLTAMFKDVKAVRIELFCEHTRPHRVDRQKGLRVTVLDKGRLKEALSYVSGFLSILSLAVKVGGHVIAGPAVAAWLPDFSELIAIASVIDAGGLDNVNLQEQARPTTAFLGWQQWLVSVLENNGGMTESNIADKFMLRRAFCKDPCKVVWLCPEHYNQEQPLPLV